MKLITCIVPVILVARSVLASTGNHLLDSGISAGVELAQAIADKNFENTMGKLLTKVNPYLGMVEPIVGLLSGLTGLRRETAELQYMRRMLSTIENRFDRVDVRFDEIARQIDWATIRRQLYPYERRIISLDYKLQELFNSTTNSSYSSSYESFVGAYENDIQDSTRMLHYHIVSTNFVFSKNILEAAIEGTQNDRRAVQVFMLGLTKLILLGSRVEMAYTKLKFPGQLMRIKHEWYLKIQAMRRAMSRADAEIVSKFRTVSANDAKKIIRDNEGSANWVVADLIHDRLSDKFYWRTWLVVVYDDVRGNDVHQIFYCGGYHDFRFNGYNFMIVSKSKTSDRISFDLADNILASPEVCTYTVYGAFWGGGQVETCKEAKTVLESIEDNMDCINFSALAVIDQSANPAVLADSSHYYSTYKAPFMLIIFG
eukprot:GAHX01002373.1.p1 GENE.GAHX01002373.1~~GAHX01002373.1.p1  ORF type:complete len:428 (-),score=34.59 GAHX01002373.1:57-1340(-)